MYQKSYTFAMIKPDAVKNKFDGLIIDKIITSGFLIEGVLLTTWCASMAEEFYKEHSERTFFKDLVAFTTSGPSYSLILSLPTPDCVEAWRARIGSTDPTKAPVGTLRKMYGSQSGPMMHNAVHGSDSPQSALREIKCVAPYRGSGFGTHLIGRDWLMAAGGR
jgi:nucleoside-diphosphate kinase